MLRRMSCSLAVIIAITGTSKCLSQEADTYQSVRSLEESRKRRQAESQRIWWQRLMPANQTKVAAEEPKPVNNAIQMEPKPRVMDTAAVMATEKDNYLRRLAVCDKLREVAFDTKDENLRIQADLLEQKAWRIYESRVSLTRTGRSEPVNQPEESGSVASRKETEVANAESPIRSISGTGSENMKKE